MILKVKETRAGFTHNIIIGRFAFFVVLDESGMPFDTAKLVEQAMHFNYVVVTGSNIMEQKKEVADFVQKLKKKNDKTFVQLETKGNIVPVGLAHVDNLLFITNIPLKRSGQEMSKRINVKALGWFMDANTYFRFDVETKDDVDEINMLVHETELSKRMIYLNIVDGNMEEMLRLAKAFGYNLCINMEEAYNNERVHETEL